MAYSRRRGLLSALLDLAESPEMLDQPAMGNRPWALRPRDVVDVLALLKGHRLGHAGPAGKVRPMQQRAADLQALDERLQPHLRTLLGVDVAVRSAPTRMSSHPDLPSAIACQTTNCWVNFFFALSMNSAKTSTLSNTE